MSKIHQLSETTEKQFEVELFEKKDYKNPNPSQSKIRSANSSFLVRNKIAQLLESSTSHGLPNIVRSNRPSIKILWAICFVASVSVCSYMVFLSVSQYLEYGVVTKSELLAETKSTFPTVSICDLDPLPSTYAQSFVYATVASITQEQTLLNAKIDLIGDFILENKIALFKASIKDTGQDIGDENRKKLGFSLSESIKLCLFNQIKCSISDFLWYFDPTLGNCYRFNADSASLRESNKPGPQYGLTLIVLKSSSQNALSFIMSEGLRVFVHNSTEKPQNSNGIDVQASKLTNIGVKRSFTSKQAYPYSECVDLSGFSSEFYAAIINSNVTYHQQDCFDLCLQKNIITYCGCYDPSYMKLYNSTACLTYAKSMCVNDQYTLFRNQSISDDCLSQCPLECDTVAYDFTVSSSNFPTTNLYDLVKKTLGNMTYEQLKEKAIGINVYYSSLSYTSLSESPQTSVIDLFSNIGGTLGLYIGISFLSLVEIVEIVLECIFIAFNL